ncbi:MAG: RDD family protein [Candidatus Diapherotrites archaeon]
MNAKNFVFASFGERLAAAIIDNVLMFFLLIIIHLIVLVVQETFIIQFLFYFWYLAGIAYFITANKKGQSIGKKLLKIKVVNSEGEQLSWIRAIFRWFFSNISIMLFFLGDLLILFDKNKQGLHDKIVGSYVIQEAKGSDPK